MPYIDMWVHLIWATKNRQPFINKEIKGLLIPHIHKNAISKDIHIDFLNCVQDHIHLLVSLRPNQDISGVVRLIKGESSHWINQQKLVKANFRWQHDDIAISISKSGISRVRGIYQESGEPSPDKIFF